jgi:hypothetical protein
MPAWLIPALGILSAILLACFGYILRLADGQGELKREFAALASEHRTLCSEHSKALDTLPGMSRTLDRLVYRQELQDAHAADVLHSPTHKGRDDLVEGMLNGGLSAEELEETISLLLAAQKSERRGDKRIAAALLLGRAKSELRKLEERGAHG